MVYETPPNKEINSAEEDKDSESSFNFRLNSNPETPKNGYDQPEFLKKRISHLNNPQNMGEMETTENFGKGFTNQSQDTDQEFNISLSESTHNGVLDIMKKIQTNSAMYSEISNLVLNLEEASGIILQLENNNTDLRKENQILKQRLENTEDLKNRIENELRVWKSRGERILRIDEKLEEKFRMLSKEIQRSNSKNRERSPSESRSRSKSRKSPQNSLNAPKKTTVTFQD